MDTQPPDIDESLASLAKTYRLSDSLLARWRKSGVDIQDAREIVKKVWGARTTAPEWQSVIDELRSDLDQDSERYWRREKLKKETEKLQLHNDLAAGEQFKREDVDQANMALGSAFKLALMESQSVLPPQLVGLTEAEIEKVLAQVNRKMLSDLSDLQSSLWQSVRAKYREPDAQEEKPAPKARRKPAVD